MTFEFFIYLDLRNLIFFMHPDRVIALLLAISMAVIDWASRYSDIDCFPIKFMDLQTNVQQTMKKVEDIIDLQVK